MARFVKDLQLNKPDDFVEFIMNDYLKKNQFSLSDWKGEAAYRAGDAMMEGFKYLKWSYQGGVLHVEAWLKGSFGKEMGLEGFVGILMKKPYRESLEQLFTTLMQEIPASGDGTFSAASSIPVQTVDNTGAANMSLVLGALSCIFCWIPIVAILFGCLGFSRARMGSGSSNAGRAKVGKIFCILGVVIAIVLWALNILAIML